jgi:hypothetical protein
VNDLVTRGRAIACLTAAVALILAGCASAPVDERPDPTEVVSAYLTALSEGDTAAAAALDARAFEEAPFIQGDGRGFLETDALASAVERIAVTTVTLLNSDADSAAVEVEFSIQKQTYTCKLRLDWNDDSERWELVDSLANLIQVRVISAGVPGPVPFTLSGVAPSGSFDEIDPPASYVYPGVYELAVDIDPALFVDPATPIVTELVIGPLNSTSPDTGQIVKVDFTLR